MDLKKIRKSLGLTQEEMARALDLHQSTLCRYERGEIPLDKRMKLAIEAMQARAA